MATQPSYIKTKETIVLTGSVYDLTNGGYGIGLTISACLLERGATAEQDILTELHSAVVDNEGTYYIVLNSTDIPTGAFSLTLSAFQLGQQLEFEQKIEIDYSQFANSQELHDLHIYTKPVKKINGNVKRKNDTPAVACCVELVSAVDNTVIGTSAITDIDGNYEIGYIAADVSEEEKQKKVFLKFYNNEDTAITQTTPDQTIADYQSAYANNTRNAMYPSEQFINDIIVEKNDNGYTEFYLVESVTENVDHWATTERLIYIKDETTQYDANENRIISHWRIFNNKKVLDKRVVFDKNQKERTVYTKKSNIPINPTGNQLTSALTGKILLRKQVVGLSDEEKNREIDFNDTENLYIVEIEEYKASVSPVIISDLMANSINFKFTKDSIDLYTRLTNREAEYKEAVNNQNSTL